MCDEKARPGAATSMRLRCWGVGAVMVAVALGACAAEREDGAEASGEMTVERIVALSEEAMGAGAVEALRLEIDYPDHDYLVRSDVNRPNLIWSGADDVYAMAFDGSTAWYQDFRPGEDGEPQALQMIPEDQLKDFEVDIANYFPAYFDHPAEYLGLETVEGGEAYKLEVMLPLGARVFYWVDASTHLPVRVMSSVVVEGTEYTFERTFSDFEDIDGVMYPRSFTYGGRDGETLVGTFESVQINPTLDEGRFAVPVGAH